MDGEHLLHLAALGALQAEALKIGERLCEAVQMDRMLPSLRSLTW